VVHGDKVAVDAILDHPDIAAVSFVGSTPIARYVHGRAGAAGKRVQALGGAKNHAVVLPDADLDDAARQITAAGYGSAGQRCMAVSAVVAVGPAADPLVEKLSALAGDIRVGPGRDPHSEMGPVVTAESRDRVLSYVDRGLSAGAELVVDGRKAAVPAAGYFVGPCLFDRVTAGMDVYADEIFGPVLVVLRADTLDDAIDIVNANPYGNGVALFTGAGEAARRFQRAVSVGMIGLNVPIPVPMAFYSFGGWKASLFGDTHVHGPEGVAFYTRAKVVTSRWPLPAGEPVRAHLHFPVAT
jgi:malonate-semialdehyde dehydrogenase (acetylating) / methylmalonate-semialdehyde dehydrogenase